MYPQLQHSARVRAGLSAFFERELVYRPWLRYPLVALVNTVVRGRSFDDAMDTAVRMVRSLESSAAAGAFSILGPAPAPLTRLRGEHRVQFFLKGTRRPAMRQALAAVLAEIPAVRRKVTVDVDPLSVL